MASFEGWKSDSLNQRPLVFRVGFWVDLKPNETKMPLTTVTRDASRKPDCKSIMKTKFLFRIFGLAILATVQQVAAQNTTFTYQGRVTDHGTNFTGSGLFKFALVTSTNTSRQATASANRSGSFIISYNLLDGGSGYTTPPNVHVSGGGGSGATAHAIVSGGVVTDVLADLAGSGYSSTPTVTIDPPPENLSYTTYWSNDGTSVDGSEPAATVSVGVSGGLFTVLLGDTNLANMAAIDASLFFQPHLQLRIWFDDGVSGSAVLSPVQNLTPTPYAVIAQNVSGTVSASQLTGTLPPGSLSGGYGNAVSLANPANYFAGNGGGLTNLNVDASQLASGTLPDARLSPNVALLNRTPQTFTGANIFDRSVDGTGRLIVNGSSGLVLSNFTGLGFQYYNSSGEGAIMSSYNDGYGYLSFYTKAAFGYPITKQMIIEQYGGVAIDQGNYNNGLLNHSTTNGVGLTFGVTSGEGIASKRTAGGNQYGLDFYTSFARRLSLSNSGNLSFADATSSLIFPAATTNNNPMIFMFDSGTANADRMVIAHSPSYPNWGLQYSDPLDKFNFLSSGTAVMTVDLGGQRVGVGTPTPGAKLDVRGDVKLGDTGQYFATGGGENLRIVRGIVQPSGAIFNGTGYAIAHTGTGTYTITFTSAFTDAPALNITAYTAASPAVANCTSGTSSSFQITIWVGAAKADSWFNFTAIGGR